MSGQYPDYGEMLRHQDELYPEEEPKKETTVAELTETLKAHGLEGCDVMVHASLKCMRPVERGPQGVVDAFVDAVGPRGRLLFPTYDFHQWSEEHYWDWQESPSRMGVITEVARNDPRFVRTSHPMLSYALYDEEWWRTPPSTSPYTVHWRNSHGPASLFDRFAGKDGLLVSLGALSDTNTGFAVSNVGFTFIHHAEMYANAPHRRYKDFSGLYVHDRGVAMKTYTASVRQPGYRTAVSPAMQVMEDEGVIDNIQLGHSRTHIGSAQNVFAWVHVAVKERPELLREVVGS